SLSIAHRVTWLPQIHPHTLSTVEYTRRHLRVTFSFDGVAPRTPTHAHSLAPSPTRTVRVARSLRSLARLLPVVHRIFTTFPGASEICARRPESNNGMPMPVLTSRLRPVAISPRSCSLFE